MCAIHPIAVRAVYARRAALPGLPIIGVGVPVPARVLAGLEAWCVERGIEQIAELSGGAHG